MKTKMKLRKRLISNEETKLTVLSELFRHTHGGHFPQKNPIGPSVRRKGKEILKTRTVGIVFK